MYLAKLAENFLGPNFTPQCERSEKIEQGVLAKSASRRMADMGLVATTGDGGINGGQETCGETVENRIACDGHAIVIEYFVLWFVRVAPAQKHRSSNYGRGKKGFERATAIGPLLHSGAVI